MVRRRPIRRIQPHERIPMHFAGEVGGPAEAAVIQEPDGEFRIQTRKHEYPLDADEPEIHIEAENVFVIKKASLTEIDWSRLASWLDSDGTLSMRVQERGAKTYYNPRVAIYNSNFRIIQWLLDHFGGTHHEFKRQVKPNHKKQYMWLMAAENMVEILQKALPYLLLKQEQAELIIRFYKGKPTKRALSPEETNRQGEIHKAVSTLNQRGLAKEDDAHTHVQIQPEDIKRLSNLDEAGIRGGIHSKRTYLMALHDGSLWVWKQTGAEERDEIFVYELARRMFRAIVPEVQPVFVPKLGWGSAMRKVAGVPAGRVDGLHGYFHGNDEMMADLTAMLVLDYMTGNPDRHSNNWFIMHNDRLAAIDNGWAGEDLAMSFADVFQPARLAGMMEDERLWPQLLAGITSLIQELSGKGDEVRALAEEIGIDKKEAVEMVRLWEVKLQKLTRLVETELHKPLGKSWDERFWEQVDKAGEHWLWTGAQTPNGYGVVYLGGRTTTAHRWAYEQENGPLDKNLDVDHVCNTRLCVRTDHLQPLSRRENLAKAGAIDKSHCPQGHPYSEENTYHWPADGPNKGKRKCRTCHREGTAKARAETGKVKKEKVYIAPGQQPPLGVKVEEGPRGGHYYESEGIPRGAHQTFREDPEETAEWAQRRADPQYEPAPSGDVPAIKDFTEPEELFAWVASNATNEEFLHDFFAQIWTNEMTNAEVTAVAMHGYEPGEEGEYGEGTIEVNANLYDPDTDEKVGYLSRTFNQRGEVHHDIFVVEPHMRGKGIALAINKKAEEDYYSMGFEYISLTADISVGKYAWAPQGYDFADRHDIHYAWENLVRFRWEENDTYWEEQEKKVEEHYAEVLDEIDSRGGKVSEEEWAEERRQMEEERDTRLSELNGLRHSEDPTEEYNDEMVESFDFEHAWELAALDDGYDYGGMTLGKAFMLSNYMPEWSGYKNLDPDSDGARIGDIYYDKKKHKIAAAAKKKRLREEEPERAPGVRPTPAEQPGWDAWYMQTLHPVESRLHEKITQSQAAIMRRVQYLRQNNNHDEANALVREANERVNAMQTRYYDWARGEIQGAGYQPRGVYVSRAAPQEWRDQNTGVLTREVAEKIKRLEEETVRLMDERRAAGESTADITDRAYTQRQQIMREYRERGREMLHSAGYEPYGDFHKSMVTKAKGGRIPVELPKGSKVRPGVTDEGAHDIDENTDQEWREALKLLRERGILGE